MLHVLQAEDKEAGVAIDAGTSQYFIVPVTFHFPVTVHLLSSYFPVTLPVLTWYFPVTLSVLSWYCYTYV